MDIVHKGGGVSGKVKYPYFFTFTKSTIHISPSFYDICQNWYSKKYIVHNQGGGEGEFQTHVYKVH